MRTAMPLTRVALMSPAGAARGQVCILSFVQHFDEFLDLPCTRELPASLSVGACTHDICMVGFGDSRLMTSSTKRRS